MENSQNNQILNRLSNAMKTPRVSAKKIVSEYYDIPSGLKKKELKELGFNKQKDMYDYFINLFEDEVGETPTQFIRTEKIRLEAYKRERNKRINNYKEKILEDHIHGFKNTKYKTNTKNQEELYYNAKKRMEEDGYFGQLVLYFTSKQDNKVRRTTITENYMDTYEEFKQRLDEIKQGEVVGSGALPDNEYNFVENVYNIVNTSITGNGKSKFMIFNTRGIESKKGDCWKIVLEEVLGEEVNDKKYSNLLDFSEIINKYNKENDDKICIIGNSFSIKGNFMKMKEGKETVKFDCGKRSFKGFKPNINDINLVVLNNIKNDEIKRYVIYDEMNKHYDIIDGDLEINENVLISYCNKVFKNTDKGYKLLFTPTEINKTNKLNDYVNNYKVFFDYETVIDFEVKNCMKEYSLSILVCTDDDLEELDKIDKDEDKEKLNKFLYPKNRPPRVICFKGFDCSKQFINWIIEFNALYLGKKNNRCDLVSFNGSNFDNFILLNALLKQDEYDIFSTKLNLSDVFYNGNQILNFKINDKHSTFDVRKHLVGSLKSCCNGFKVKICSKLDFNHNHAQKLYEKGQLINYIMDNKELEEYNNMDCISLAIIFKRYREALINMPQTKRYGEKLTENKTIGSVIYNIFKDHQKIINQKREKKKEKPLIFNKLSMEYYKDILKFKCAGRVEMFNGIQEIVEKMCSLDICSMYPFVMAVLKDAYYPCGEIKETEKYVKDKIGFYYCDIDQSNLKEKNLPNIYPKKNYNIKADGSEGELIGNDWDTEEVLKDYMISTKMIEQLKKYGCGVVIKKGIYFEDKIKGCELFEFILEFMMKKNEQDINKKTKPELYNSALRETLKILMNSLSGKVIEGLHTEKTEITDAYKFQQLVSRMDDDIEISSEEHKDLVKKCWDKANKANCANEYTRKEYYEKLYQGAYNNLIKKKDKLNNVESINAINIIGNKVFTSYKINEESELSKQRPIYLGVMIYDYSKCYIYDTLYAVVGKKDLVYTDTDAGKFRHKILSKVMDYYTNNEVPYWDEVLKYDKRYKGHKLFNPNSKVFGSYENEMDELPNNDMFYCFQKKSWVCIDSEKYLNGDRENSFKMSFKGVPKNSIILPDPSTNKYDWLKLTYNKEGTKKQENKDYEIEITDTKKCLEYYENGTAIKDDLITFCKDLYNNKYIYVLTQNFKRVVKNTSRNVKLEDNDKFNIFNNTIQVQPVVKKIRI